MIFTEYHKSLLYEKLNIGFSCTFCGTHFLNKIDYTVHVHEHYNTLLKKGTFVCKVCNKQFGNQKIYQIHTQIHAHGTPEEQSLLAEAEAEAAAAALAAATKVSQNAAKEAACSSSSSTNESESNSPEENSEKKATKRKKVKPPPAPPKKKGFSKIRMEDCLRCDECSCIYIDESDYYKHMRNFHGLNNPNKKSPKKKNCRSCCLNCKGGSCNSLQLPVNMDNVTKTCNGLFKFTMQDNIKDRWSKMVSERLSEAVVIKEDPDAPNPALETLLSQVEETELNNPALEALLSQVEVKIKTEPQDYYEYE